MEPLISSRLTEAGWGFKKKDGAGERVHYTPILQICVSAHILGCLLV